MEFSDYMRFVIALAFVLALIAILSWAVRRYGIGGRATARRGKSRRLEIVEILAIDSRRRVVLLRRDDTEHLVLLGSGSDMVIESGLKSLAGPRAAPAGNSGDNPRMGVTEQT